MNSQEYLAKGAGIMASRKDAELGTDVQGGNVPLPKLEEFPADQVELIKK